MFIDARQLENGSRVDCDLCIVGAGAAGITLARELRNAGLRIALLESGGLVADADTQALYTGRGLGAVGDAYLLDTRLRFFGGTTNHWGGLCAPLDSEDFETRSWIPDSGWPVSRESLRPYYEGAQRLCELGPYDYDVASWFAPHPAPRFSSPRIETRMWQMSPPTRFGTRHRAEIESSPQIDSYLWANAVNLEPDRDLRRVARVDATTLTGRHFSVHARRFVLATGAIENARLLLASNRVASAGLGNQNDLVGRYFMDHPHFHYQESAAVAIFSQPGLYKITDAFPLRGSVVRPGFGLSHRVQSEEGLLNGIFTLRELPSRQLPLSKGVTDLLHATAGMGGHDLRGRNAHVFSKFEQAPNPESRVTLGSERDALGQNTAVLDWRLGSLDASSLIRSLRILAEELGRTGQGRVHLAEWVREGTFDWRRVGVRGGPHHMGTTRMSSDPHHGVVDADCLVHGLENLYVAGSSVFPTAGWANPTLTLVALALRLADHLRARS
jgi:choline dehydrogenase-like flavoprotein